MLANAEGAGVDRDEAAIVEIGTRKLCGRDQESTRRGEDGAIKRKNRAR